MNETIKVARHRNTPYIFNYTTNGGLKRYEWAGSKGNRIDAKQLPVEAVDWLLMNSSCFKNGELVIIEDSEETKELVENLGSELDEYRNNTHTKDEIIKLLQGNMLKMKKEFELITIDAEKKFVIEVAKELKDELAGGKLKFLADWINVPQDILFD